MKLLKSTLNNLLGLAGYQITRLKQSPEENKRVLNNNKTSDHSNVSEHTVNNSSATAQREQTNIFRKKFRRYISTHEVLKVHFGSGPRILKDWVNIDLSFEPFEAYMKYYTDKHYPENIRGNEDDFYAFDPTKAPLPIPDNSVDIIFHEDFMEHINQRDQVAFLAETLRVLKKGGIHRVNTPDLTKSMQDHSDFSKGFRGVFFDEWDKHQHFNVITKSTLKELALLVGYSKVVFNHKNGSTSSLVPLEYRPDPNDRPADGNVFADLVK